jgi:DNA polymerase elongation subunit (family B)
MNNYEKTKDEKYKETAKVYDILQNVKKICLNSAYGAMGNVYFRFYNIILASSVTLSGQLVIRYIEKICNEILNEKFGTSGVDYCIASDTDSVYLDYSLLKNKVKSVEDIDAFNKEVLRHIDKSLKDLAQYLNCRENKIFLKREVIADRGIFLAKKRYCLNVLNSEGIQYKEPKIKMMGVEAIKSSTPKICREILKNSIKTILQENNDKLIENLEKYREQFIQSSIYDIAFPRNVNNLEKYSLTSKSVPVHVRGALVFNKLIKDRKLMEIHPIISGDKIKFLYLKEPNPFESHVISFPANVTLPKEIIDDITKYVDYEKMIEKAVIDPLKILTEPINWKIERSFNLLDLFA